MDLKIKKLLYLLTRNARQSLKELSSSIKISQQGIYYQIKGLEEKGMSYETLIDYSRIGNTNILVGINLKVFTPIEKQQFVKYLLAFEEVLSVESRDMTVDLLIEFSVSNLSKFNKIYSSIVEEKHKIMSTVFVYPVIVKHTYLRNYLIKKAKYEDYITLGDRPVQQLSEESLAVLKILQKKPKETLLGIAKEAGLSIKQTSSIKKKLEHDKIIRGYRCNYVGDGIVKKNVLIRLNNSSYLRINEFREFVKNLPNVVEMWKIIGEYHVLLTIEEFEHTDTISQLRKEFLFDRYSIF